MKSALRPMHPGEFLREIVLPEAAVPKTRIARLLGLSRQTLYDLINEKSPMTASLALRLSRLFGNSPQFWLNLQTEYDVATLAKSMKRDLDKIPPLKAA